MAVSQHPLYGTSLGWRIPFQANILLKNLQEEYISHPGDLHSRIQTDLVFCSQTEFNGLSGKESACNAGATGTWVRSLEDPLEEDMATHSTILAWRIPWTEEPGELQSKGLQRVRHD